jgi:inner membrane protein
MPTILSHAIAGAAIGQAFAPCSRRAEITWISAICAMAPDVDVLGFVFGSSYEDLLGHRGVTHSIFFACLTALAVTYLIRKRVPPADHIQVLLCIFAATVLHGILDAFTNGGLGVAFFAPFDNRRYFFAVRPILVSPIGIAPFLTKRGPDTLLSEMTWVWPPAILVFLTARLARCR